LGGGGLWTGFAWFEMEWIDGPFWTRKLNIGKMKAVASSETSVVIYRSTRRHIPKDLILILLCFPYAVNFMILPVFQIVLVSLFTPPVLSAFFHYCLPSFHFHNSLRLSCLLYFLVIFLFSILSTYLVWECIVMVKKNRFRNFEELTGFELPWIWKKRLLLFCVSPLLYIYVCVYVRACAGWRVYG
jgi:hypothetical protein